MAADDYILAAKPNQGKLSAEIKDSFQMFAVDGLKEEINCGHGSVESAPLFADCRSELC